MLVLTRKYQEKIRIGDGITITVLRIKGKAVRLGIEAPADVPVIRGELVFDGDAALPASLPMLGATGAAAVTCRTRPRTGGAEPAWTTESHPQGAGPIRGLQPTTEVGLRRVPRDKMAEILPRFVAGSGPLRPLMDQRSTTV
jgi:carbon storage regulator